MSDCTCGVGATDLITHEGDCPRRCAFWRRDHYSEQVAQCGHPVGHDGKHWLNLYRGSPSARREYGRVWPVPVPDCTEPEPLERHSCQYYYLDPSDHCTLTAGHRGHHVLVSGVSNAERYPSNA